MNKTTIYVKHNLEHRQYFDRKDIDDFTHVLPLFNYLNDVINSTPDEYLQDLIIEWDSGYNNFDFIISHPFISEEECEERKLLAKLLEKYPQEK